MSQVLLSSPNNELADQEPQPYLVSRFHFSAPYRISICVILAIGLILLAFYLNVTKSLSFGLMATICFECLSMMMAGLVSIMSIASYASEKQNFNLILGCGFVCVAFIDGCQFILSYQAQSLATPHLGIELHTWIWLLSRCCMVIFLLLGLVCFLTANLNKTTKFAKLLLPVCMLLSMLITLLSLSGEYAIPASYKQDSTIHYPMELLPVVLSFVALAGYGYVGRWRVEPLHYAILLSLIVSTVLGLFYIPLSQLPYDGLFIGALILKISSYFIIFLGLVYTMTIHFKKSIRLTRELKRFTLKLQRSNQELEEFAVISSHDLKEPLRKIQMFSTLIAHECESVVNEDARYYLDAMVKCVEKMSEQYEALLTYSRMTRDFGALEEVDLNEILADVVQFLAKRISAENAKIVVQSPLPTISAQPVQMRQLFQNLISNSLKFRNPSWDPLIQISSTIRVMGKSNTIINNKVCELTITDNGLGFDNRYAERVCRIFQRVHSDEEYEGTGIGLAVCKKVVERHNGIFKIQSEEGKGTIVTIVLPVMQEECHHAKFDGAKTYLDSG